MYKNGAATFSWKFFICTMNIILTAFAALLKHGGEFITVCSLECVWPHFSSPDSCSIYLRPILDFVTWEVLFMHSPQGFGGVQAWLKFILTENPVCVCVCEKRYFFGAVLMSHSDILLVSGKFAACFCSLSRIFSFLSFSVHVCISKFFNWWYL